MISFVWVLPVQFLFSINKIMVFTCSIELRKNIIVVGSVPHSLKPFKIIVVKSCMIFWLTVGIISPSFLIRVAFYK